MADPATAPASTRRAPAWRRLEHDERRRQILDAAVALFAARGYGGVSMAEVAREAGVTRGLVNHYFGAKRDLYLEVVRVALGEAAAAVRTDRGLSVEEALAANVDAFLDYVERFPALALASVGLAGVPVDADVEEIVDTAREAVIDRILVNHTGRSDAPETVRFALRGYLGLVEAASYEWLQRERVARDEVRLLLVETLLALMRQVIPALLARERA